ncbi:MAG TPA: bifunctional methylenetetrahydrofolate dehydrogenase/methenyltetrahydrofolate cyclohydrolase [Bdellovibrionales bacterium]|nr:MAG: bifunctional methylenetetrahydrofolate dehydrogenase/methenyltetrahydrofolate cyclohydrolase [Bdellovibrionales bacterium GWB1_52_6]OFZ04393.1 MAG: bifunctional methylenetetrahydrofolate dehydrogenase/methenyltetrahydrofolate cyclohydrolase [Bdellovibrionales bacterium GWA1_52_35]HAR42094.1 bifunctional methylenetetrahydrofolate dehydrogenase/methenyltetrahydrofolate cyclohydrolase [Bdellovibrionales bacterium]HCM40751.1 bifunctional methylenetetrahydrofolate dehydrogenase/methenyltetrah
MPTLIAAKPVVEKLRLTTEERSRAFRKKYGRAPKLAVVLVGENPASVIYTRKKGETAIAMGMEHVSVTFPDTATPDEVKAAIDKLNTDPHVDGILIQRPLPKSFKEEEVLYWVAPAKDVDAFHPENTGRLSLGLPCFKPCTPAGVMELLKFYGVNPAGKLACVIGRSSIVGKPMAALLLQADATVLHCHSKTPNLKQIANQADIVVVAAGKPGLVDSSYIKTGAIVIDVGIHRTDAGKVVGDVIFDDVAAKASAITPVPGGVGPMTIAVLLENTIWAAEQRESK